MTIGLNTCSNTWRLTHCVDAVGCNAQHAAIAVEKADLRACRVQTGRVRLDNDPLVVVDVALLDCSDKLPTHRRRAPFRSCRRPSMSNSTRER